MDSAKLAIIQAEIGLDPFTTPKWAVEAAAGAKRQALIQWCIEMGVPRASACVASNKKLALAYCTRNYCEGWRRGALGLRTRAAAVPTVSDDFLDGAIDTVEPEGAPATAPVPVPVGSGSDEKALAELALRLNAMVKPLAEAAASQHLKQLLPEARRDIIADATVAAAAAAAAAAEAELASRRPARSIEIIHRNEDGTAAAAAQNIGPQHFMFEKLLRLLQIKNHRGSRMNIFISGPTGSGKTTAVCTAAAALQAKCEVESSLDDAFKITGYNDQAGRYVETAFFRRFTKGGFIVFDEIDAFSPSALVAVNPATANDFYQFPHGKFQRHKDCIIIACANTWGLGANSTYVGRSRLDAASMDRFKPKLEWPYDETLERTVAEATAGDLGLRWFKRILAMRSAAQRQGLQIIVSPRATYDGSALLLAGFSEAEVIEMTVTAGLSNEQCTAIGAPRQSASLHIVAATAAAGGAAP